MRHRLIDRGQYKHVCFKFQEANSLVDSAIDDTQISLTGLSASVRHMQHLNKLLSSSMLYCRRQSLCSYIPVHDKCTKKALIFVIWMMIEADLMNARACTYIMRPSGTARQFISFIFDDACLLAVGSCCASPE